MNNIDRIFTTDVVKFAEQYFDYLAKILNKIEKKEIAEFASRLLSARANGRAIFFAGNGGSAATASHFANDIGIGTNSYKMPFRAISLTDNMPVITAIGNDFGYDDIFVRQLKILAHPKDIFVAISASGNSPNLIRAIEYAKSVDIWTLAITAFDGGRMKAIANQCVHVPTELKEYGPAEDAHMILDHLIGAYLTRIVCREDV